MNDLYLGTTLHYKGYDSKIYFSLDDKLYHGKIEGIPDLVTWECEYDDLANLYSEFVGAVEDYECFKQDLEIMKERTDQIIGE